MQLNPEITPSQHEPVGPGVMNPISVGLISRSKLAPEKWVEKYAAQVREMVENDPALRELVEKSPDQAVIVVERKLEEGEERELH